MKKIISMLLLLVIVISLCACGEKTGSETAGANGSQEKTFRVGYARYDITPEESVPLGGFGNTDKRLSTNILRRLYVSCIAITDEQDNTILLVSADLQQPSKWIMYCRPVIAEAVGVPENHIMFNGSHTHAGPDAGQTSFDSIQRWLDLVHTQALNACKDAMADRKPAIMYYGSVETEGLNFIKHYKYIDENGNVQYFGDNFGTAVYNETTQHTTQIDQTMFLMKFEREGEKNIVFASWRAHPLLDGSSTATNVSSDYIGAFREAIELQLDCEFSFFQGAAGNNNCKTRLVAESRTTDTAEYGALLAGYAIEGLTNNMTKVENPGLIQTRCTQLEQDVNHDTDSLYYAAREVQTVFTTTNSYSEAAQAGEPYGIRSPYMANAIVSRFNMGETEVSELDAFAIGDYVAIVSAPNELFDQLGEQTEAGSSYPMTVTLGYTNGYTGYIPTAYGFEHTSYETDVCHFKPGIGEIMVDTFLTMLDEMDG